MSTIAEHQRRTIAAFRELRSTVSSTYVLPVLQGFAPAEYVGHIRQYADQLEQGAWVGVGSVCKRNASPTSVEAVLWAIHEERPDLRLHGFGLKKTALESPAVNALLYSADSMAWSYAARREGRAANDHKEAQTYVARIADAPVQLMALL